MKYTSLFCAAIAAMGMQVFAAPSEVKSDDFESYDRGGADEVEVKTINAFATKGWTVVGEDQSAIVSHFSGDTANQALKLNTNGETLELTAATTKDYTATVSMKVEMVASDTPVDMSTDTTTQTALFLYKPDENAAAGTLMAFSNDSDGGTNLWVELTDANFTALDDKDVANITIVINYATEEATYTVNGTEFAPIPLANPNAAAAHKLSSVAFRGTGFVDDLFVGEEQTGTFATFIYELAGEEPSTQSKDISAANFKFSSYVEPQTGSNTVAVLYSRSGNVDTEMSTLTLTDDTWSITDASQFTEGGTYVVKVTFEVKPSTITVYKNSVSAENLLDTITQDWFTEFTYTPQNATFEGWTLDGEEQFESVSIESLEADAYVIVLTGYVATQSETKTWTTADVVSGSFSWTGYNPGAGTATFTCTLNGMPGANDSFGQFTVTTTTALGGSTTNQVAVTVTPVLTALPTLTGTVSGLPTGGDSLFLIGVADAEAAPAAGEGN